ncbi:hypothetical protein CFS9_16200 [Flavobacterium sp. CFS9]|uniref:Por secretion system C-terminal sorting domain-containing protein n=1 Tax=Flavobacterium sp. CFS9 TaxID=3143118 RepID=A0AAT9H0L0_9FLAO
MIKKITIILFIFIYTFCHSQECLSDQYLRKIKSQNPLLENRIKKVISTFTSNQKSITNKQLNTQEAMIASDEIIVIPVVFNIIHNGEAIGTGRNIEQNKIDELITILNEAYSGKYGGIDTKIRFCLAKQNTVGQITTGVNRFLGNSTYDMYDINTEFNLITDQKIKKNFSSGFPNNLFLNIWVADLVRNGFNDMRGYSSFPYSLEDDPSTDEDESAYSRLDGVVLDYLQIGINTTNPPNINSSNGTAAVHEIGHWLGLFHTFKDDDSIACNETSCETQGDMICDTESIPSSGNTNVAPGNCLGYNCNGQITNAVQNFMDYQSAARLICRTKFTVGQKKRMRDILSFYRSSFYSQGTLFDFTACKASSYGGGGGGCTEDSTLPSQRISRPNIYQDLSQFVNPSIKFGERLEVNDKWLVTIYNTTAYYVTGTPPPTTPIVNTILIYKREGCKYALHQMIDVPLNNSQKTTDFGLLLNGDEIIISSAVTDQVSICRLNQSNDTWSIVQQIQNISSTSEVGNSTYTIGKFLFILERNTNADNIFRVYYKNDSGTYVFHQNIAVPGFNLPSLGKNIKSGNFTKNIINFNSSSFTGSYDPLEILVSNGRGSFVMFELNSSNVWNLKTTVQPAGLSSSEGVLDFEVSNDFIYVITGLNPNGYLNDTMYLYTFKITDRTGTNFPFQGDYNKQEIISNTQINSDVKLKVFNNQFLFIDNIQFEPLGLFYNSNFGSASLPNWQRNNKKKITCANRVGDPDDFEVFGNLLFYGYGGATINIYNLSDILTREGYDQTFIDNSDFYNKKVNIMPSDYSTSAQIITIGESNKIEFNYVEKEFIANNRVVLKPGTIISGGSKVKLKITDIYGLCNSIVASKKSNEKLDFRDDEYLSTTELEKTIEREGKAILSPNPNNGVFTISFGIKEGTLVNCIIYDSTGKIMFSDHTDKSVMSVNLPHLQTGVYLIRLTGNNYNETIKFIKQ